MVEPEWDDETRFKALALSRHDDECCPGCGQHKSIRENPDENVFTFDEEVCRLCAAQDKFGRIVADAHDKADKRLGEDPSPRRTRAGDGHHIYMRRATPDEVARRTPREG